MSSESYIASRLLRHWFPLESRLWQYGDLKQNLLNRATTSHGGFNIDHLFEIFYDRVCLAHLNSIGNSEEFPYEGAPPALMVIRWRDLLKSLPQSFFENDFDKDCIEKIQEAFRPLIPNISDGSYVLENERYDKIPDSEFEIRSQNVKQGKLEAFAVGHLGHMVYIVFYQGYLLICNRGERPYIAAEDGSEKVCACIEAFKINPSKFSSDCLKKLIRNAYNSDSLEAFPYLYGELLNSLEFERDPICDLLIQLSSSDQKVGNCSSTSLKEALMGAYALLSIGAVFSGSDDNLKNEFSVKGVDFSKFSTQEASRSNPLFVVENHSTSLKSKGTYSSLLLQRAKNFKNRISAHARAFYFDLYWKKHKDKGHKTYDSDLVSRCAKKALLHLRKVQLSSEPYSSLKDF